MQFAIEVFISSKCALSRRVNSTLFASEKTGKETYYTKTKVLLFSSTMNEQGAVSNSRQSEEAETTLAKVFERHQSDLRIFQYIIDAFAALAFPFGV